MPCRHSSQRFSFHSVHHIQTTPGPPVFCHPRRLPELPSLNLKLWCWRAQLDCLKLHVISGHGKLLPRRFLPSAVKYQSSLHGALSGLRGAQPLTWTSELDTAFSKCKEVLSEVTLLTHPAADVPLGLFTDASACHVGVALMQCVDGNWRPLAFFSKTLATAQSQWPAYYRVLLPSAIYSAVQHFRHVLEAQHCTIYTDHKPIAYAFLQRREKLPPVQLYQLSFIGQFTTDIQHISGTDNVVANAFSRISCIAPPPVDLKTIAEAHKVDTELLDFQTSDNTLKLKSSSSCHPGSRATARLISTRFVWPRVQSDCRTWAHACLRCQRSKIPRHNSSPLQTFAATPLRFRYIHIDIIGPLPPAKSYRYCLTATDRFSRWVEAWPMESITAEDVEQALFAVWISLFGSPEKITTDQGHQFESQLLKRLGMFTAFKRSRTTSYHPCSNGIIKRVYRQLKASLMCHTDSSWFEALPVVLLGIRSVFKEDLQSSSAELVYGEPSHLPGGFISPLPAKMQSISASDFVDRLRTRISRRRTVPASCHARGTPFVFKDLETCTPMLCFEMTPFVAHYNLHIRDFIAFCNVSERFLCCAWAQRKFVSAWIA
ncbi:uncharacterized protein TNIN_267221 [Trichonephila inaurata madagascariensis]|uniref:RNA-directed DNA polymerase n=1 Tax=Trichonephila inaurata madagascariensis TaxID=2747483 RepID=A0A8X6JM14_9ARAC|nr:uncharacterized protein TNIN_267221 [Trichonephila inaurata madagascariensis]